MSASKLSDSDLFIDLKYYIFVSYSTAEKKIYIYIFFMVRCRMF